jgi:hypothetical protein
MCRLGREFTDEAGMATWRRYQQTSGLVDISRYVLSREMDVGSWPAAADDSMRSR